VSPPRSGGRRSRDFDLRPVERRRSERQRLIAPRLLVLFLLGCVLFGYPILGLFSEPRHFGSIPALFVYLFLVWGLFIGALAWLVESDPGRRLRRRLRP